MKTHRAMGGLELLKKVTNPKWRQKAETSIENLGRSIRTHLQSRAKRIQKKFDADYKAGIRY